MRTKRTVRVLIQVKDDALLDKFWTLLRVWCGVCAWLRLRVETGDNLGRGMRNKSKGICMWWLPLGRGRPKHPESGSRRGCRPHPGRWGPRRSSPGRRGTWTHLSSSPATLPSGTLPGQPGTASCRPQPRPHPRRGWRPSPRCRPSISRPSRSRAPAPGHHVKIHPHFPPPPSSKRPKRRDDF